MLAHRGRRPTAAGSTSAATSRAIGGGSRQYIAAVSATTGAAPAADLPVLAPSARCIDLDISADGTQIFAALGDLENQAIAWSTTTGNRQWFHQVDGDTQAIRTSTATSTSASTRARSTTTASACSWPTPPPARSSRPTDLPINSFYGVWDIDAHRGRARASAASSPTSAGVNVQGVAILPGTGGTPTSTSSTSSTSSTATTTTTARQPDRRDARGRRARPGATSTTASNQGTAWRAATFNDSTWKQGPPSSATATVTRQTVVSVRAEREPEVPDQLLPPPVHWWTRRTSAAPSRCNLQRDDGAVVYLNGTEIVRSNMPAGTVPASTTLGVADVSGERRAGRSSPSRSRRRRSSTARTRSRSRSTRTTGPSSDSASTSTSSLSSEPEARPTGWGRATRDRARRRGRPLRPRRRSPRASSGSPPSAERQAPGSEVQSESCSRTVPPSTQPASTSSRTDSRRGLGPPVPAPGGPEHRPHAELRAARLPFERERAVRRPVPDRARRPDASPTASWARATSSRIARGLMRFWLRCTSACTPTSCPAAATSAARPGAARTMSPSMKKVALPPEVVEHARGTPASTPGRARRRTSARRGRACPTPASAGDTY